jgi:hypothetical protein
MRGSRLGPSRSPLRPDASRNSDRSANPRAPRELSGGSNRESGCSAIGNQAGFAWAGQPGAASAAQQQKAKRRYNRLRGAAEQLVTKQVAIQYDTNMSNGDLILKIIAHQHNYGEHVAISQNSVGWDLLNSCACEPSPV